MDEALVHGFLVVCVLLSGESHQAFVEEIDLEWVEGCDESVDTQIILETFNQVRIRHVLGDNIARLAFDFLFLADDFDATTTGRCARLHDVHVAEIFSLTIHAELAIIVREQVGLWTEIELLKHSLHPADILPHHVLATDLERLREVIDLLILGGFFQVFGLGLTCPHDIPFRAIWSNYAEASSLERIDHRIVDMRSL